MGGPAAGGEVEGGEGGDGAAEGVADEGEGVGWVRGDGFREGGQDGGAGVEPGGVEAGVDGAVCAFGGVGGGRGVGVVG